MKRIFKKYTYRRKGKFGWALYSNRVDNIYVILKANNKMGAEFAMCAMFGRHWSVTWVYEGKS